MKKIFTLFLVSLTLVGFAQMRPSAEGIHGTFKADAAQNAKEGTMLFPGNWENATDFVLFTSTNGGYVNGTNGYGDLAKAMMFEVTDAYTIIGVYLWFGAVEGTTGTVEVKIWEFDALPTTEIVSKSVNVSDITFGDSFETDLFYVEFDEPVEVTADYAIGIAFDNIGDSEVGLYSSDDGQGGGLDRAYEMWSDGAWFSYLSDSSWGLDLDMGIFPVVPASGFNVTFNVDMSAVEGFDPATHNVWVTGSFVGWAQPGTEGSVELTLVTPKEAEVVFEEHFDGAIPDTWETVINDGPVGWAWTDVGGNYGGQLASTTADNGYAMLDSDGLGTGAAEDADLISPSLDMTNVGGEILLSLEHMARTYGLAECRIYVSADDFETSTMIYEWKDAAQNEFNTDDGTAPSPAVINSSFDISEFGGEPNVKIKFNWIGSYDYWWLIDDIVITGTVTGGGEEYIYTATVVNVPEGEIQYKYFSDVIGAGWDGGEWAGDPNRVVNIVADVTLDDVFGQQPGTNVDEVIVEDGITVFPNPVRETLNIRSASQIDYLRVFDLSGRVVFNADVMDFNTTIDVSPFNNGIYILQMISGQEVTTRKIQVVK